jgi:hypothetical protein
MISRRLVLIAGQPLRPAKLILYKARKFGTSKWLNLLTISRNESERMDSQQLAKSPMCAALLRESAR